MLIARKVPTVLLAILLAHFANEDILLVKRARRYVKLVPLVNMLLRQVNRNAITVPEESMSLFRHRLHAQTAPLVDIVFMIWIHRLVLFPVMSVDPETTQKLDRQSVMSAPPENNGMVLDNLALIATKIVIVVLEVLRIANIVLSVLLVQPVVLRVLALLRVGLLLPLPVGLLLPLPVRTQLLIQLLILMLHLLRLQIVTFSTCVILMATDGTVVFLG